MNCNLLLKVAVLKRFKKWLDELVETLSHKAVAEIGISYAGNNEWANEMKSLLQKYVEKPISVLETGSIFKLIQEKMHGLF